MVNKSLTKVFTEFEAAKTKKEKIDVLLANNSKILQMVLKGTFDNSIKWSFTELPHYKPDPAPEGYSYSTLWNELRRAYIFTEAYTKVEPKRKESILTQVLENLPAGDATVYGNMILKKQPAKGLTALFVKEVFPGLLESGDFATSE